MQLQSLKMLPLTFRRICIYIELDLGVKVTQNVTQYPLNHVTNSDTKFDVATSNGLGGDAFTSKYIIRP